MILEGDGVADFEKMFFHSELPVKPEFVTRLSDAGGVSDEGNSAVAYLISKDSPSFSGTVLKVLNPNGGDKPSFYRNVVVLDYFKTIGFNRGLALDQFLVPYLYKSGTYLGQPACIEMLMPHVKGIDLQDFIKRLPDQQIHVFILKTFLLMLKMEEKQIVQLDGKLSNLGFDEIGNRVSMIDFGAVFSPVTQGWGEATMNFQTSIIAGVKAMSDSLYYLVKDKPSLGVISQQLGKFSQNGADSFLEVLKALAT